MIEPKEFPRPNRYPSKIWKWVQTLFSTRHFLAGRDFSDVVQEGRPVPDDL